MIIKLSNTPKNVQIITQLEKDCFFDDAWSKNAVQTEFSNTFSHFFAYNENSKTLGYICVRQTADELQICNLAVSPSHRQRGIGQALLNFLTEFAQKSNLNQIVLEVNTQNIPAINLYKKCGFEIAGTRKNFYRQSRYQTRDAFTLVKKIETTSHCK